MASTNGVQKTERSGTVSIQQFLDSHQYTQNGILRYEKIFGEDFISTGGRETTEEVVKLLNLKPGQKVLDVGCGIGGSAFYMASNFGVSVHGIDLSQNCLAIANQKLATKYQELMDKVSFTEANVLEMEVEEGSLDVIYSRDCILHIEDKKTLFTKFYSWLKPKGRVLITDYNMGDVKEYTKEYLDYLADRNYHLLTVTEYGRILEGIFPEVWADDRTDTFVKVLQRELDLFAHHKEGFVKEFSKEDYDYIRDGWEAKVKRANSKQQAWGLFLATKL